MQRLENVFGRRVRSAVAAFAIASVFFVAIPAGASQMTLVSSSPFCSTLLGFHPHAPTNARDWKAYNAFAKSVLPTFKKLAETAPNTGTKDLMTQLISQLEFDARATSFGAFKSYWTSHMRHWEYDWQQFMAADLKCVEALY